MVTTRAALTVFLPVLAFALVLAACAGSSGESVAAPIDDAPPAAADPDPGPDPEPTESPDDSETPDDPPAVEPEGSDEVVVYFARMDDSGPWVEPETHLLDQPTVGVAKAAMELLVAGETHAPGLTSVAPSGTQVLGVNIHDGVLTVDLSGEVARHGSGSATEVAFAHQLAHTAAQFTDVDAVVLWVEGRAIEELWGHLDWSEPIEPDPWAISPITFTSHTWGDEVEAGAVTVRGEARVFEAHVDLRLIAPDGTVTRTWATAEDGAPERGPWTETFTMGTPGTWTIEAAESDPSDGEGRPPFVTKVELRVGR